MPRISKICWCGAVALAAVLSISASVGAGESHEKELEALRQSLMKYQDVYTAVREGYYSTVGCVRYSGEKMEGHADYAKGAMGIHFLNKELVTPKPDPMRPPVLLYEPKDGKLQLTGVEWVVPLISGLAKRPELFGQPFLGPMEGHVPIIPQEFLHYDLHAWLFKENPLGMFAPTHPDVHCEGYDFDLLEHPKKLVPGP
jgi:hypothetical protein